LWLYQARYALYLQFMYSSFKGLLLGTGLHHRYHAMSQFGMFPEGTQASEAKRGTNCSPAPIPFILHDSKTATYKAQTIKVHISDTVSEKCPFCTGGEPKTYLQVFDIFAVFIRKKNLKTDTDELKVAIKDKQLLLDSHFAMEPKGDVASEYVTDCWVCLFICS